MVSSHPFLSGSKHLSWFKDPSKRYSVLLQARHSFAPLLWFRYGFPQTPPPPSGENGNCNVICKREEREKNLYANGYVLIRMQLSGIGR